MQPEINIGLIGHVDHGKTTLTEKLSGKWTDTHSEELKRGITIRLGYADSTFYKCSKCNKYCVRGKCSCGKDAEKVKTVSFVDAPGHETLMATMLCGATIMDGAILMVAANEECPQPQTREHLMALQIAGIKNIVIVQNKIDLVSEEDAMKNYKQIREFLKETDYSDAPIIPMSALHGTNVDILIATILEKIPTPERDPDAIPMMFVARSFDINKPGSDPIKMKGGILGGSLKQGTLKVGEEIEIRPGRRIQRHNKFVCQPLKTKIIGLMTGGTPVESIGPGGSVAVLTELDPSVVGADNLVGSVVGYPEKLPPIWDELKFKTNLLDRVVGAKDDLVVKPLAENEVLMLNINSAATVGVIKELRKGIATCTLKLPVCAEPGSKVTISRSLGNRWRLIGYGIIQ
ncbi:translation initiation factor IF-2 subunit gamma [Candidatus Woesearchaeota archaeon]|nr:translation initiation factor IF-2 subunit gamma [Candidatus Woesearchaeota archaeon]